MNNCEGRGGKDADEAERRLAREEGETARRDAPEAERARRRHDRHTRRESPHRPLVEAGAVASGRSMEHIDLAACIWVSIADDAQAAEAALRDKIAYYGAGFSPLILQRLGVTKADFSPIEQAIMTDRDPVKTRALVTGSMLHIGVVGTTDDLIARLEPLVSMGARHLSFGPSLGPDPHLAVARIGRFVLPHFRGA